MRIHCGVVWAIALVSVQCSEASAPIEDPPIIESPSGRIAFVVENSAGNGALYVANSDGTDLRLLHAGPTYYVRPRWSPDRRRIAFSMSPLEPPSSSIYVIDVDGPDGLVRLTDGTNPAWSPDGSRIAFTRSSAAGPGIHVMSADGSNVRQLTFPNNPVQCTQGSSAADWKADWSPDGQKILFERDIHTSEDGGFDCALDGWGYVPNVYVMNADGTGLRRLRSVDLWREDSDPAWSPDGHFIAYSSFSTGLHIVDKNGAYAAERVDAPFTGLALDPAWSPDGKQLLVLSVNLALRNTQLVIVDIASQTIRPLSFPTVSGKLVGGAAWSH